MKRARQLVLAAAVVVLSAAYSSNVYAQTTFGGLGFPHIPGYGASLLPYSLGHVPTPPYFALHPPVYYSYPVPRTYGYSPYAYPGGVRTPEIEPVKPTVILNPHVKQSKGEEAERDRDRTASASKMIFNPYVESDGVRLANQ